MINENLEAMCGILESKKKGANAREYMWEQVEWSFERGIHALHEAVMLAKGDLSDERKHKVI